MKSLKHWTVALVSVIIGWGATAVIVNMGLPQKLYASGVTLVSSVFGQAGAVNIPVTTTDIATPGSPPAAGKTIWYTKSGTLCSFSPASVENCTGSGGGGPTTNQNIRTVGTFFDGGGAALTAMTRCTNVYYAGTINQVVIITDQSGSATVDVKTVAFGSYTGPGSTSSITAADIPALSSAVTFSDTTLTGWTTALSANTVVCFAMTSPMTATWLQIELKVAAN